MGAWGHGVFENDAALDWLADAERRGAAAAVSNAMATADAGYLEVDEGSSVIAAAALVAAAVDGDRAGLPPRARAVLDDARTVADLAKLGGHAASALGNVLLPTSELASLWQDGPDGTAWRTSVDRLLLRLRSGRASSPDEKDA